MTTAFTRLKSSALLACGLVFMVPAGARAEEPTSATLRELFTSPPVSARPGAFWPWLNGNVDRDRIVYDLDQMVEKGMGGAEVWDVEARRNTAMVPAGPEFLGPESAANIRFALAEGKKRGLRMGMITSSGWNAGGTWVTPDWASKELVVSSVVTTGGGAVSLKLPFPQVSPECPRGADGMPLFHKEVAVLAVPDSGTSEIESLEKVVDVSEHLDAGGTLNWTAPPGDWRIFRFVCTNTGQKLIVPSPKSNGLFIDFLDPEATRRHLQVILDRLGITKENAAEVGLNYLEVDSMELHEGNPWTDRFGGWFEGRFGYDPTPWLPAIVGYTIGEQEASKAFVYDYRKAVSDLLIHSHYETGTSYLKPYGIEFVGEAGGPGPPIWKTCPVDALKALGNVSIPRGEFWVKHRFIFLIKEVASAAHIYGKQLVDAEAFTTWRRFEDSPSELKKVADRAFSEGLNHLTIHTFAHSPDNMGMPGSVYHAGVDINPNVTWWPFARPFFDYLSRCSVLLRQGLPVADVLWYYGDQAPNFFPAHHEVKEVPRLPGLGSGYDYDVINSDVILKRLEVSDGRFVLPEGTSYRVLAFPPEAEMSREVLEKLIEFVKQGGVVAGQLPERLAGLHNAEEKAQFLEKVGAAVEDLARTGMSTYEQGRVYRGLKLNEVLEAEDILPDMEIQGRPDDAFSFVHRSVGDQEIYFVRWTGNAPVKSTAVFRVDPRSRAEVWDAATGEMRSIETSVTKDDRVAINLGLIEPEADSSAIFVFSRGDAAAAPMAQHSSSQSQDIGGAWSVTFPPRLGAPASIELDKLVSWTDHPTTGVRHFSGIATYTTTFTVTAAQLQEWSTASLNLGRVGDVARVLVNGKDGGVRWKAPYSVEITPYLKAGENVLEIQVANLWHNRLVGDAKRARPERRITKTNLDYQDKAKAELLPSGLMGPVGVTWYKYDLQEAR